MNTQTTYTVRGYLHTIFAGLMLVVVIAALPVTASAGTVTFSFVTSCQPCGLPITFQTASTVNQPTIEQGVGIDTLQSGAFTFPITGGKLAYTSAGATSIPCFDLFQWCATYDAAGGSGTIKGSVFGLGSGSTLLDITSFLPGGTSSQDIKPEGFTLFDSTYEGNINPVILANLGLNPAVTFGYGSVHDYVFVANFSEAEVDTIVNVTFTQTPEPGSLTLLGSGLIGLGGILRRRFRG